MALYRIRHNLSPWVYYSSEGLAKKFSYMKTRSIGRWFSQLEKDGHIKSKIKNKHRYDTTKSYLLTELEEYDKNGKTAGQNGERVRQNGEPISQSGLTRPSLSDTLSDSLLNIDDLFQKFWENYPKKVGKPVAEKSFKKLEPTKSLSKKIIKGLNKYKNTEQWKNTEFIPNPATFLDQRRWEDEIQEREKKPYYRGDKIIETNGKRWVITSSGDKLEFAGSEKDIEYR